MCVVDQWCIISSGVVYRTVLYKLSQAQADTTMQRNRPVTMTRTVATVMDMIARAIAMVSVVWCLWLLYF